MGESIVKKADEIEKEISSEFASASKKSGILDKIIDFFFSNDIRKHLVWIVLIAALLRFLIARSISALGDEMVHGPHAIGFLHSGLISTVLHSPLWFYLTDIVFAIFGVTLFSSRFVSFFYGTLTVLVIYLIASKIFNKKIGIISAFLLSISYFVLRYTLIEMDAGLIFFVLMAFYFFLLAMEKGKFPWLAAILIGIAALLKTLSLFFVPSFLLAFFFFNKGKTKFWKNIKSMILFGLLILLVFSPIIVHNYLWYKDSGMVDSYFAQYFFPSLRYHWAGQLGYDQGVLENLPRFFEGFISTSKYFFIYDPIIVPLSLLGMLLSFFLIGKENRKYWYFLMSFQFITFILLLLSNWLHTHYSTLMPIIAIFAAISVDAIARKLKKFGYRKVLCIILILILAFQLYLLWPNISSTSALAKMKSYVNNNMDKNSVVLTDSRIYTGRVAWLFSDFHYLEAAFLSDIMSINQNITGYGQVDVPTKLYFIECARDDCGWGTITGGQLNDSMEQMVQSISQQAVLETTILDGGGSDDQKTGRGMKPGGEYFKVYSAAINLKPQTISIIDSTHNWFYYPMNYEPKSEIPDTYEVIGVLDNLIYSFAWLIIILSIVLAILSPILIIYKVYKQK